MQFYEKGALLLLWAVLGLVFLYIFHKKRKEAAVSQLVQLKLLKSLAPNLNTRALLKRFIIFSIALVFFILALARPQWGEEKKTVERKGIDVIFLLDTSLSMLTEDVKPSRIVRAQLIVDAFLKKLKGDRVGLVTFAGSAFLQSPLTMDYSAFHLFLDASDVGIIPEQGTDLKEAIKIAISAFPEKNKKHKAIVILSDGEDHMRGEETLAKQAKKAGIRIYSIGVGTKDGAPIPLRAKKGRVNGYKRDSSGEVVISRLHENVLKRVAEVSGGKFFMASPNEREVELIYRDMQSMGKKSIKEKKISLKEEKFQIFLLIGFVFLILEDLVRATIRRRKKSGLISVMLLGLIWVATSAFTLDSLADSAKKGNKHYKKQEYDKAVDIYRKEQVKNPENPELKYNIGSALYKARNFKDSNYQFKSAVKKIEEKEFKGKTYYNLGNAQYRMGKIEEAIKSYEKAIELNPDDVDAKFNYELLKKKKQQQEDQQQQQDKNKDQNKQDKKDKQQQKDQNKQDKQNKQNKQDQQQKQQQNQQQQQQNQKNQQSQKNNQQQNQQQDKSQSKSDRQDKQKQDQQNQQKQDKQDEQQKQDQDNQDQQKQQDQQQKQDKQDKQDQQNDQQKQDQQQGQGQQDQQDQRDKKEQEKNQKNKKSGKQDEQQDQKDKDKQEQQKGGSSEKQDKQDQKDKDKDKQDKGEDKQDKSQQDKGKEEQDKQKEQQKGQQGKDKDKEKQKQDKGEEDKQKEQQDKGDEEKDKKDKGEDEKDKEKKKGEDEEDGLKQGKGEEEKEEEKKKGEDEKEDQKDEGEDEDSEMPYPDEQEEDMQPQPMNPGMGEFGPQPEGAEKKGAAPSAAGQTARKFFDGTMSEQAAMKILNTLQNEEKELLHLRRPPQKRKQTPSNVKDW